MDEAHIQNYKVALAVLSWTDKTKEPILFRLFAHQNAVDSYVNVLLADLLGLWAEDTLKPGVLASALKKCGLSDAAFSRDRNSSPLPCREAYRLFAAYLCLRENMKEMLDYAKDEDELVKRSRREKRIDVLNNIQSKFQMFDKRHPDVLWQGFEEEGNRDYLWKGIWNDKALIQKPTDYAALESCLTDFLFKVQKRGEGGQGNNGNDSPPPPQYTVHFIDYMLRYLELILFTIFGEIVLVLKFGKWWWLQIMITIIGLGWASQKEEGVLDEKLLFWGRYSGYLMLVLPWLNKLSILPFVWVELIVVGYSMLVIVRNHDDDISKKQNHYPILYPIIALLLILVLPIWHDLL